MGPLSALLLPSAPLLLEKFFGSFFQKSLGSLTNETGNNSGC
jgi:hypothetical protein